MASRSRTTRRARRFRAGKREYVWSTVTGTFPGVGTPMTQVPLVTRFDWARNAAGTGGLEKGAVIQRVVGNITFTQPAPAAVTFLEELTNCYAGLLVRDEDDASGVDLTIDAFQENWMQMWSGQTYYAVNNVVTLAWAVREQLSFNVDVRVKRKLTTEDELGLYLGSLPTVGTNADAFFFLRTLIALP